MVPSPLNRRNSTEPVTANAIIRISHTSSHTAVTPNNRSIRSISHVANVALYKVAHEDRHPEEHDLRYLVGHLNLLEVLDDLRTARKEDVTGEANVCMRKCLKPSEVKQQQPSHLGAISEELDEWDDAGSDEDEEGDDAASNESTDDDDDDFDFNVDLSLQAHPHGKSKPLTVTVTPLDSSSSDDDEELEAAEVHLSNAREADALLPQRHAKRHDSAVDVEDQRKAGEGIEAQRRHVEFLSLPIRGC